MSKSGFSSQLSASLPLEFVLEFDRPNICLVLGVPDSFSLFWKVVLFYRRCISGTKGLSIMLKVVSQMIDAVAGENGKLNFPSVGKFRNII